MLLRPGDAHTKLEQGPCTHIDLAFPAGTARELVCYLYQDDGPLRALAELPLPPQAQLTAGDAADVQERLARLNRLPPAPQRPRETGTFQDNDLGFVHMDIKHLPKLRDQGGVTRKRVLYVAIDRASRWVHLAVRDDEGASSAMAIMMRCPMPPEISCG